MRPDSTRIRRLRATAPGRDPLATRHGLERLLASAQLGSPSIPPEAILCIRNLRDPLPGLLSPLDSSLRPPARWEAACQSRIDQFAASAARPALSTLPPPPDTPAILFGSETELLACLAAAAASGRIHREWWWSGLLLPDEVHEWTRRWLRYPEHIPSAVNLLAAASQLSEVNAAIPPAAAHALLTSLQVTFALPSVPAPLGSPASTNRLPASPSIPAPDNPAPPSPGHLPPTANPPRSQPNPHPAASAAAAPSQPPWLSPPLREFPTAILTTDAGRFLATAWLLMRAPEIPRRPGFWTELLSWKPQTPPPVEPKHVATPPASSSGIHGASGEVTSPVSPRRFQAPVTPPQTDLSQPPSLSPARHSVELQPPPEAAGVAPDPGPANLPPAPSKTDPAIGRNAPAAPEPQPLLRDRFETAHGGVFYLLNVALALELYGDFTQPLRPGITLSPWDFLLLVGHATSGPGFLADPLARRLLDWAGHREFDIVSDPDECIASTTPFAPPSDWRLPECWLKPFGPDPVLTWHEAGDRRIAKHPAGFVVVDESLQPTPTNPPSTTPLRVWRDWLMPYLNARVGLALGLPQAETSQALASLLDHPARVTCTDVQISVHFDLARHPIAVRIAGLDRDPGWIPAAGRSVAFFYE